MCRLVGARVDVDAGLGTRDVLGVGHEHAAALEHGQQRVAHVAFVEHVMVDVDVEGERVDGARDGHRGDRVAHAAPLLCIGAIIVVVVVAALTSAALAARLTARRRRGRRLGVAVHRATALEQTAVELGEQRMRMMVDGLLLLMRRWRRHARVDHVRIVVHAVHVIA